MPVRVSSTLYAVLSGSIYPLNKHLARCLTLSGVTYRTIPKTTSGKIARAMCKKAHVSGALDNDTVFLWGNDITTTGNLSSATAEMDAQAERDETPWSSPTGGSGGGGIEESKSFRGEGGGRGCPKDMPVDAILEGVQSEVARILKADATAIPTVRRSCRDVGVWWYNKYLWGLRWSWVSALLQSPFGSLRCQTKVVVCVGASRRRFCFRLFRLLAVTAN